MVIPDNKKLIVVFARISAKIVKEFSIGLGGWVIERESYVHPIVVSLVSFSETTLIFEIEFAKSIFATQCSNKSQVSSKTS